MLCEFLYFIPDHTVSGRVRVDPEHPLEALIQRMEADHCTVSPLLQDIEEDAVAIARHLAVRDPSVPDPSVRQLGDRTMLLSFETEDIGAAFDLLVQLAIDARTGLAELSSAEIYLHGDDDRIVSLETTDFFVPWTSPASLRSFVHRTNPANVGDWEHERDSRFVETGYLDEFLLLFRFPRTDRFIQTYFDAPAGTWVVEASEEGRRWMTRYEDEESVAEVLRAWFFRGMVVLDFGRWRSVEGDCGVSGRDDSGKYVVDPALLEDEDDDGDSGDDWNDDAHNPTPSPVLIG